MKKTQVLWKLTAGVTAAGMLMAGTAFAEELPVEYTFADTSYVQIMAMYAAENGLLAYGSTGEEVTYVQQLLQNIGYFNSVIDGVYGSATEAAVTQFQKDFGQYVDGIVGAATLQALQNANGGAQAGTNAGAADNSAATDNTSTASGNLMFGSRGEQVLKLQQKLQELGYQIGTADGDFGQKTEAAVKEFQKANGLYVDGVAGPGTQGVLFSGSAAGAQTPAEPAAESQQDSSTDTNITLGYGSRGDAVKKLQEGLQILGYRITSADGAFGTETETAVKEFQEDNSLFVDGIAGPSTLNKLYQGNPNHAAPTTVETSDNLTFGSTGTAVRNLQKRLSELGYLSTEPDGDYGRDTAIAVKNFQLVNDLYADGIAGAQTIRKINSDDSQPYNQEKIDSFTTEVQKLARQKLDQVGWSLRAAYDWCAKIPYVDDTAYTVADGATYAFTHNAGDCVCKASAFCVMARELGYQSTVIWGSVLLGNGNQGDHAWTETVVDGTTYVIDPEFETQEGRNGYMINYGQRGTWRYTKEKAWDY